MEEELATFIRGHLVTVVVLLVALGGLWALFRRYYLLCPHCRRPARRTRAWRQCPHCGRQYHNTLTRMDR